MTRTLIALAAIATTMGSLAAVNASTLPTHRTISTTRDGKPILLARMVVTATPLDE
ncbi:MAG TPA: hypothetical protein VF463_10460 [Sphingobium sp.]